MGRIGLEALKSVGLRGIVFQETPFSPDSRSAGQDFSVLRTNVEGLLKSATSKVRIGISPHTPYTVSGPLFGMIADYSKSEGHPVSIHLAESADEHRMMMTGESFFKAFLEREGLVWNAPGTSATAFLDSTGILATRPLFAHCIHLSDDDVADLRSPSTFVLRTEKSCPAPAVFADDEECLGRQGIPKGVSISAKYFGVGDARRREGSRDGR